MLSVLKIGGSVLRDDASYARVAAFLRDRLADTPQERLAVIVSARYGETDRLLAEARAIAPEPERAALDLLWSVGETESVARLGLHLQRLGVASAPLNVHQTGLHVPDTASGGHVSVRPLALLSAFARARVAIVPGFFAVGAGSAIASLGRGGSDLTAVLLAAAVEADRCELVKDVAGYYTADPHVVPDAAQIHDLPIDRALALATDGCDLVQRSALEAADRHRLPLVVRCLDAAAPVTHVHPRRSDNGIRYQDDSRRATLGA